MDKQERIEFFEKWIEALRSGDYEQGEGRLLNDHGDKDKFCCLGVACDISDRVEWNENRAVPVGFGKKYDGDVHELPDEFRKELGLSRIQQEILFEMNDGAQYYKDDKHSFDEIADYIENNILPEIKNEEVSDE